jgi:hypothetical protein
MFILCSYRIIVSSCRAHSLEPDFRSVNIIKNAISAHNVIIQTLEEADDPTMMIVMDDNRDRKYELDFEKPAIRLPIMATMEADRKYTRGEQSYVGWVSDV